MRKENAARNAAVSVVARLVEQILAFVSRTVFIWFLSTEYLGITSLFANILQVLNLAELGVGTAINVALYKPLAVGDKEKVKSFMKLYKWAYMLIGFIVLLIGGVLIPFLPVFIKGDTDLVNITIVYGIYLAKSVLSYWMFASKRSLLEADQKGYINSIYDYSIMCAFKVLQVFLLFILKDTPEISFYVYCLSDLFTSVVSNIFVSIRVNKKYPYIREKNVEPIPKEEKKALFKNVYGVALYKISSTVNGSADSIIISSFIGTAILGLYSNYLMIASAIFKILNLAFNSITSSVGNLNVLGTDEQKYQTFNNLHLISMWINGFCIICIWVLINPFLVSVWLGSEYQLGELVVFMLCLNYLVDSLMESPIRFRNACGLYWQSRYRAVLTVFINVGLSILAVTVLDWGIPGILLATIISRLSVTLWVDTYLVHKYVLHRSPKKYLIKYFLSLLLVVATGGIIKLICIKMPVDSVLFLFVRLLLCLTIPNLLWWLIFRKTSEFAYFKGLLLGSLKKFKKILNKRTVKNG